MEYLDNKNSDISRINFQLNLFVASLCFLVELCLVILLLKECISFSSLLFIHFSLMIVLFLVMIMLWVFKTDIRIFIMLFIETFFLGSIGPLIIIIILLLNKFIFTDTTEAIENITQIMENSYYTESEALYNRLIFTKGSESDYSKSEPFIDIMQYGTLEEKQQVLIMIRRYFRPEYSGILFKALEDSENNIRVQAASLVAALENEATEKFKALSTIAGESDNIVNTAQDFIKYYEYYIESNILTYNDNIAVTLEKILEKLKSLRQKHPHICDVHTLIGQIFFKKNKYREAYEALKACVECGKCERESFVMFILLKSLFKLKKYNKLRYFASLGSNMYKKNKWTSENLKEILEFWSN